MDITEPFTFLMEVGRRKPTDGTASQSFMSSITEVLDNGMWERVDQLLSLDELTKTLKSLEKNKTPGSDSLQTELYSALRDLTGQDLLEVYEKTFSRISYTYMWDVLSRMGFEEGIYNWIRLLDINIISAIAQIHDQFKLAAGDKNKELTPNECCRLAHSKVQDYGLKLGAAAAK
eukprot:g44657.t1